VRNRKVDDGRRTHSWAKSCVAPIHQGCAVPRYGPRVAKAGRGALTIVVLLILAVVWAAVLVPPWLRNRADARPADSITAFRHRLRVLERTGPPGSVQHTGFASSFRAPTGPVTPAAYRPRPAGPPPAYSAYSP